MLSHPTGIQFFLGLVIGLTGAAIGAFTDFRLAYSQEKPRPISGGIMLVIAGAVNSIAGVIAMIISFILTGKLGPALMIGFGVLVGFSLGFLLIAVFWIRFMREEDE